MNRAFYTEGISSFLGTSADVIIGILARNNTFSLVSEQRDAWLAEIRILQDALRGFEGTIYFEFSIPRMGKRIDVVLLIDAVIFVLEFKVGESTFPAYAVDQVWDYALDLKYFHESSHQEFVAPVLIATNAQRFSSAIFMTPQDDKLLHPVKCSVELLGAVIKDVLRFCEGQTLDRSSWETGRYCPTPTIVEAAMALYGGHSVADISRSDASAINLSETSQAISEIIDASRKASRKSICFVTGVPGAGKTLVGLNVATAHLHDADAYHSVFLSGNGPLVSVLREALTRDKVLRAKERKEKLRKCEVMSTVKTVIQNVHHFRDECLIDTAGPPIEHVALFDEAQRAWNVEQTSSFMLRKKKKPNFNQSEPEFLISCLDRHLDWAVIVCLVGGGQEINTGEAGISEWIDSLNRSFPQWRIYISSRLTDSEYAAGHVLDKLPSRSDVFFDDKLHLGVSMRSFRAENVSLLVKQILDRDIERARCTLAEISKQYPIVITRSQSSAKRWLKMQARGSERYGVVVSSQAERLKPHAIDVKSPVDPIHWFLAGKDDVRSSYYLEDVATEFHIQGLELDWVCVTWDADFRSTKQGWEHWSFCGNRWNRIKKEERQNYLKNAYRVLLTRARQGMIIVVPYGDGDDPTRDPSFYDSTFNYLRDVGFQVIDEQEVLHKDSANSKSHKTSEPELHTVN